MASELTFEYIKFKNFPGGGGDAPRPPLVWCMQSMHHTPPQAMHANAHKFTKGTKTL